MKKSISSRSKLAETLSALMLATAFVAPAPAALAADTTAAPAATASAAKDGKKIDNPCAPGNPCGPVKKKKKKGSDNPCAPGNPCAPKK